MSKKSTYILGISCFYHDAAACLLKDGEIIAAVHEERFTRKKHDDSFPRKAIKYCLKEAGIEINDVTKVGFYEKPFLKFERILEGYMDTFPRSYQAFVASMKVWLKEKLWSKDIIKKELGYKGEIYFIEHHLAHNASSFLVSPFNEAALLTVDAVGEWTTASYGIGRGTEVKMLKEIHWPDSLGMLYSAMTYFLGFKVNSAEYKVMGAAPYGQPKYADLIMEKLIDVKDDGSFKINLKYFKYHYGLKMVGREFEELFGIPRREPEGKVEQIHWDLAASIQEVTNRIMVRIANHLHTEAGLKNIVLSGGVALNCVANTEILKYTPFEKMWINPAAGDAGGAMGVAAYIDNVILGHGRRTKLDHVYLGPEYSDERIEKYLRKLGVKYHKMPEDELYNKVAKLMSEQKIVGWFQGRMEWGPRALGNRSIVADARNKENWKRVNLKIKFRESFRPFAPSVLEEDTAKYFGVPHDLIGQDTPSPYMLLIADLRTDTIPAVTHVNNTGRLQTINREQNAKYYDLINEFKKQTGCSVIINTSFNRRGEPIVCTPEDAFHCFVYTDMDYLVMGNIIISKKDLANQGIKLKEREFELD